MKAISYVSAIIFVLGLNFIEAQSFKTPIEYLDFVASEQDEVLADIWRYTHAVAHRRSDRNILKRRTYLLESLETAISNIQNADGYLNENYKNKVLRHLEFCRDLLNQDYASIIDMHVTATQSYQAMENYVSTQELANKKLEKSQLEYDKDFYDFAKANNIEIVQSEDDLSQQMKFSNEVLTYYNDLYLMFFKSYINEINLKDALDAEHTEEISQHANALKETAKEGLKNLEDQEKFKQDDALIKANKAAFEYFIDESGEKVNTITKFLQLNEDFENIRNTLDQKDERSRTNQDIENYNKKVQQVNAGIKTYNSVLSELDRSRNEVLNNINSTYAMFLEKHTQLE